MGIEDNKIAFLPLRSPLRHKADTPWLFNFAKIILFWIPPLAFGVLCIYAWTRLWMSDMDTGLALCGYGVRVALGEGLRPFEVTCGSMQCISRLFSFVHTTDHVGIAEDFVINFVSRPGHNRKSNKKGWNATLTKEHQPFIFHKQRNLMSYRKHTIVDDNLPTTDHS